MATAIESLKRQIASYEDTLLGLRQQLAEAEHNQRQREKALEEKKPRARDPLDHDFNFGISDDFRSEVFAVLGQGVDGIDTNSRDEQKRWPLDQNEYKRYGRQLIMPEIGLAGKSCIFFLPPMN